MHSLATNEVYSRIISGPYNVETVLQIGGTASLIKDHYTTEELTSMGAPLYGMDRLISMTTNGAVFTESVPCIGSCVSRTITVRILNRELQPIGRSARLVPFVRVVNSSEASEWIPKGVFNVDTRKKTVSYDGDDVLDLTGYDAMLKAEVKYEESSTGTSSGGNITENPGFDEEDGTQQTVTIPDDLKIINSCASILGVTVDPRTTSVINARYTVPKLTDYSVREVLGFVGAMYGGNFVLSDIGRLQFIPLNGGGSA